MEPLDIFDIDSGFDEPDERDYLHEEVYGEFGGGITDKVVMNNRSPIYNQNAQKETYYACPIYGLTHAYNEGNAIESERLKTTRSFEDPLNITREVVASGAEWFNPKMGGSLQGALKYFRATERIAGNTLVKKAQTLGIDEVIKVIDQGFQCYSGSRNIAWKEMSKYKDGKVIVGSSFGHLFHIGAYKIEDNWKYAGIRQSVGDKYFDKGWAWLREDQMDILYSVYAIVDKDNSKEIYSYKAKVKGIWNGDRPKDIATRLEFATMLERASGNYIWNGDRPNDIPTNIERKIMMIRAFNKFQVGVQTRDQVAIFCAKNI